MSAPYSQHFRFEGFGGNSKVQSYLEGVTRQQRPLSPRPMNSGEKTDEKSDRVTCRMPLLGSGHWFVWDPCGIVCAVMTYVLIGYGELVVLFVLAPPFPSLATFICVFIFTTLATLAVIAHVKSMVTDPVSCCFLRGEQTKSAEKNTHRTFTANT